MRKGLQIAAALIVGIGCVMAWQLYAAIYHENISEDAASYLIIPKGSSYNQVVDSLERNNVLINTKSFHTVATLMKYGDTNIKSGKYPIEKGWNNRVLIGLLRAGRQLPVKVTFNNHRTIQETLGSIAQYIEPDSADLVNHIMEQQSLANYGYSSSNILSLFIPNTYELYYNYTAEQLLSRMKAEHDKFWSAKDRRQKAASLSMTESEVYTLASIVEKESQAAKERPIIAGLYLNRLKRGIALQADPTVVYAVGDFTIRRVLNKHLAVDSPYNTYKNAGLPPGPIYLPSIESIDAVLNPAQHDYLFMCAKPGYNSEHAFAKTVAQHNANANRYRRWLTSEGIR